MAGFFKKLFGDNSASKAPASNEIKLFNPIEGEVIPLSEVKDEVFSQEILGKGIAVRPSVGKVFSPANGTIQQIFDTLHAVSVLTDDGVDVLIHVGFDTVKLKGKHFKGHVTAEQKVKAGDLLIEFDIDAIKAEGYDLTSPMIVCNTYDYKDVITKTGEMKPLEEVIQLVKG